MSSQNPGIHTAPDDPNRMLTIPEVAAILRTTRKAVYAMAERGQLPGLVRVRRRLLVRQDDLLDWLHRSRAASPKEVSRRWA